MNKKTLVLFRQDLRLSDNPALYEAAKNGPILAVYILDDQTPGAFKMGEASRWWLHHSLASLEKTLDHQLNFYVGEAEKIILQLVQAHAIDAVYWNRCYEPWRIKADAALKTLLKKNNLDCKSFNASLLWEPWDVLKSDNTPYKVFTPYYKNGCLSQPHIRAPLAKPKKLTLINDTKNALPLEALALLPKVHWYQTMASLWEIGEEGAQARFSHFLENGLSDYKQGRDFPYQENVSRLSPYLHFGEISVHQIWCDTQAHALHEKTALTQSEHFLRQIAWREFSYYLLYHFPDLPEKNFHKKFDHFPWQQSSKHLSAWQKGQTGYPIVDAGMRELWQTGYMHNRVRLIVGSFLVKNLLLHWHHGERWFWNCLLDADLANNSASWQWVAGSGADAAPYFRIFNPVTQSEKFDPEGSYIRHFVPELSALPLPYLFKPWLAPEAVLKTAGVVLGETYPEPIVDLSASRQRALAAFAQLRQAEK